MKALLLSMLLGILSVASTAWAQIPPDDAITHYIPIAFETADHLSLAGHLALPKGATPPYPVVLLLVGSGPGNRYENIPGKHTADGKDSLIFKPIETALIQKGIAVLTYDKRGVHPKDTTFLSVVVEQKVFATATANSLASDALIAFDYLLSRPEIDTHRVAILGHSEGTILALKIAEQRPLQTHALFMLGLLTRSMHEVFYFQSVTNPMRYFYRMDANQDGFLDKAEYVAAITGVPSLKEEIGPWDELLKNADKTGDGKISEEEWHYLLEDINRKEDQIVNDVSLPWPAEGPSRAWVQQYFSEGPYLNRQLPFCAKIHLFQGEIDVQTPFEDALQLKDACQNRGTPLASFRSYKEEGHAFSPRVGFKQIRDTIGPIDPIVPEDVAKEAARVL